MTKSAARSESMKKRMADPALRAKALANLEKGRAARAAKKITPPPSGDPAPGKTPAAPRTTQTAPAAQRRSYGPGRWRQ